jgi:hypothetical protein
VRLKLSITVTAVLLLLVAQLFIPQNLLLAADGSGVARIFVEKPVFDFGTVSEGEIVSHVFEISNQGDGPLLITSHHAVCGCTSTILDDSEVMPGKTAQLEVRFDTNGFAGSESKIARVNTNDPKTPSLALSLQGQVQREVSATPARVFFGKVSKGKATTQNIVVSSMAGSVSITDVVSKSDYIKIDRAAKNGAGQFSVTLLENTPVGILREAVVVTTTSKTRPAITIPVFARVVGDYELFPSEVSFGLIDLESQASQSAEQTVILKSSKPVNIVALESNGDFVVAEAIDSKDSLEKILKITLKQGAKGVVKEKITIKTDHQDEAQREIFLPVYAIVAKRDS